MRSSNFAPFLGADVADLPITTFRYAAEFGRYRGNSGLWPAERPEDLWVHGPSVMGPMRSSPPCDRHAAELTLLSVVDAKPATLCC
jgi:hypothetical protein